MEQQSDILIYQSDDGVTRIETRLENETVWLTQAQLCELFQKSKATISEHIKHVFEEGELDENSVVRKFRTTATDGKNYETNYYNLDVIISVGYRVKSHQGTKFRQWATARLREYIVKGFTMNDELLKQAGGGNYFDELLARMGNRPDCFVFQLPEETHDRGLAMTSSFTCMLLAGLLITRIDQINRYEETVSRLADYGDRIITHYTPSLKDMASLDFNRALFLGSGPLQDTAQESQLKLQELTDGKVICKHDSFLGLRHGPKVVIDHKTLIFFLYSNDDYVHLYEADLVKSILATEKGIGQIGISEFPDNDLQATLAISFSEYEEKIEEDFLSVCSVLPAQILAFFKSVNLGLKPDAPSANDTITRVVQGVTIYPYHADQIHSINRF